MCDVDDAIAVWALRQGGASIDGLTTVFGNSSLARVHPVASELGQRWDIPVFRGAARPGDDHTPAVERLLAHRGVVLALGPQTNVAAALRRGASWSRLVLLGGTDRSLPNLRPLHTTELNFALDEAAAKVALAHCTDLVPMEACRDVLFRAADFAVLPPWMEARCRSWLRLGPVLTGRRGVVPWDLVAAMYLLRPEGFTVQPRGVELHSSPLRRGYLRYREGHVRVVVATHEPTFRHRWQALALGHSTHRAVDR